MIERKQIEEHLAKTFCYKCGASLDGAKLIPISEIPLALIAHVVCPKCQAESMVTITVGGSGVMPLTSDLTGSEMKDFIGLSSTSYDEILDLHKMLKKEHIWKLLQKKERSQAKRANKSEKIEKSLQ